MLTHARLLELMEYHPETGFAYWRINPNPCGGGRSIPGSRVGSIIVGTGANNKPYRYMKLKGIGQKAFSHVVFFYMTGRWPEEEMDHIDGDSLDDRWAMLREGTREQNEANKGAQRNNKLGVKGVQAAPSGRFRAQIYRAGRHIHLGTFDTLQEAQSAYINHAKGSDGEFARAA